MKTPQVIDALGALAHEHRLAIFRLLVERGPAGLPAGRIAERIGLVPSSLTFHLQNLQRAGLIAHRRESRQLFYSADFTAMNALVGYLTDNCCAESTAECCPPARQPKAAKRAANPAYRMSEPLMIRECPPQSSVVALLEAEGLPASDLTDAHLQHFFFTG